MEPGPQSSVSISTARFVLFLFKISFKKKDFFKTFSDVRYRPDPEQR